MGKARHELLARLLCMSKGRDTVLVGTDDVVDLVDERGEELAGISEKATVPVPAPYVGQGFGDLFDLPSFFMQGKDGRRGGRHGNGQEDDDESFHRRDHTSLLRR
ncbi:hypothetical protein [Slackia exigua]